MENCKSKLRVITSHLSEWLSSKKKKKKKEKKRKKKSTNNKCWRGCGKKEILLHSLWECKLVQPLWKTVWRVLEKLKIELPYDPAFLLLSINLEKTIF